MIELVLEDICLGCGVCVRTCPNDVFEATPGGAPTIARQQECHTCFLCEAYCPVDALYVSPLAGTDPSATRERVVAAGLLGSFRRGIGWQKGRPAKQAAT